MGSLQMWLSFNIFFVLFLFISKRVVSLQRILIYYRASIVYLPVDLVIVTAHPQLSTNVLKRAGLSSVLWTLN